MSVKRKGKVKFFNHKSGYGFIEPDDGGGDIFVHVTAIERSGLSGLNENDIVEFETEANPRKQGKPEAVNIAKAA